MAHVIKTMQDNLTNDPFAPVYQTPAVLAEAGRCGRAGPEDRRRLLQEGRQGDQGARRRRRASTWSRRKKADELVGRILKKRPPAERIKLLRESTNPQAQFLWAMFRDVFHYIAVHLEHDRRCRRRDVDLAIRWGFGWNSGPFEGWQAAGWKQVAEWVQEDVDCGQGAVERAAARRGCSSGAVAENQRRA